MLVDAIQYLQLFKYRHDSFARAKRMTTKKKILTSRSSDKEQLLRRRDNGGSQLVFRYDRDVSIVDRDGAACDVDKRK
ncbi:hypothetical protein ARSEF4850_008822 [Beauveria asiatica]